MGKFTDNLWRDLADEHGQDLARTERSAPGRSTGHRSPGHGVLRRPRLLAGGTLGLAGVGTALALVLSAGGAAAPKAFAVTQSDDGSVLVHLNYVKGLNLPQLNQKLAAMGTHEQVTIQMATGAASTPGAVTCKRAPSASGPQVKVLVGKNGTETIGHGQSAGNTAEGSFHLYDCVVRSDTDTGNSGNSGAGPASTAPRLKAIPKSKG